MIRERLVEQGIGQSLGFAGAATRYRASKDSVTPCLLSR